VRTENHQVDPNHINKEVGGGDAGVEVHHMSFISDNRLKKLGDKFISDFFNIQRKGAKAKIASIDAPKINQDDVVS